LDSDPQAAIRTALNRDRLERGLSYRRHAEELGVPHQTLHAFCRGEIGIAENDTFKRAILRHYPYLIAELSRASLAWMHQEQEAGSVPTSPPVAAQR
jgi:hypothetical protein